MSVEEKLERLLDQNVFTASWSADAKRLMVGWVTNIFDESRPHGEWVQVTAKDGEYYCYHKCTNCGQTIESGFDNPPIFNFCPNCGSDNRKREVKRNDR